jgi:hypothetical protein
LFSFLRNKKLDDFIALIAIVLLVFLFLLISEIKFEIDNFF